MESLKLTVRWLLLFAVEEFLGSAVADLPLDIELSTLSSRSFAAVRKADSIAADGVKVLDAFEAKETRECSWAHRKLAAAMLRDVRQHGQVRLQAALRSRHLPEDMRQWGSAQAKRIGKTIATGKRPCGFAVAFLVLSLENAIAHELVHAPETLDESALAEVQREYVEWHTMEFDGGQQHPKAKRRRACPGAE